MLQEFLLNMDDNVDETESVKRYNQYKLDFRRQQLQDFFLQHKDQEWFRSKYHPEDMAAKRAESLAALKTRLRVFLFLLDNSWLNDVLLDAEHAPTIIKLMDAGGHLSRSLCFHFLFWFPKFEFGFSAAVIKMEGGTDFDLQVLQVPPAQVASGGELSRAGGAGERSLEETMGASRSAQTESEVTGSQTEEGSGNKGRDRKVRVCTKVLVLHY